MALFVMSSLTRRKPGALANRTERHRIQRVVQSHGGLVPNVKGGFADWGFAVDAGQGNAPFHCVDYVCQRYGIRAAGKHVPPGDAPYALDNVLGLKQAHDFLHKLFRNARTSSKFRSGCRHVLILFRKAQQQMQRVTGHC